MIDANDAHLRSEIRSAWQIGALLITRVLLQHIRIRNLAVSAQNCFASIWLLFKLRSSFSS
jgi:hypothetical protein